MGKGIKRIVIELREEEHESLKRLKGNKTWKDFVIELAQFKKKVEEGGECASPGLIKDFLKKTCTNLYELASTCYPECGWEYGLLGFCVNPEDKEAAVRTFLMASNALEESLRKEDEKAAWIVKTLKTAILEVVNGDLKGAKKFIDKLLEEASFE